MRLVKYSTIDEILDDIIMVFVNHNGLVPMDWTPARKKVMFSLSNDFTNRIIELNEHLTETKIRENYVSPSHFIKAAHKFQNAGRILKLDSKVLVSTYKKMCNAAVVGWNNEVESIQQKMDKIEYVDCDLEKQGKIAYLNSIIRAFSETVYCDDHTIGGDICGPISAKEGSLIVREYKRIRPVELFEPLTDFTIKSISTYCIYSDDNISVDLIGNFTQCNDIVHSLSKAHIEVENVDGKTVVISSEEELNKLIQYFELWIVKMITYYKKLSEEEKYKLLFQCEFYAFKPLFDSCGMSWEPKSYEIVDFDNKETSVGLYRKGLSNAKTQEEIIRYTKAILDPRL